jgi:hypothetical protein
MDLNLDNYSDIDIINLLHLPIKNTYTLPELKKNTLDHVNVILNADEDLVGDKRQVTDFFIKAFLRLSKKYNIVVDPFEMQEFESVKKGLLPPLHENHIVQQNNSFVIKHQDSQPMDTFNSHLKAGMINPLKRKETRRILNLNTRFRNNYKSTSSTNFIFAMPFMLKNVVSLKLVSNEFPTAVYTFSDKLCSNSFKITTYDFVGGVIVNKITKEVIIPNGTYPPADLILYLTNNVFNVPPLDIIEVTCNINTGKFVFSRKTTAPANSYFDLDFSCKDKNPCSYTTHGEIDPIQLTAGWLLGFRKSAYSWDDNIPTPPIYTGEGLYDYHGTRYFLLSVNDFKNNHGTNIISPFQEDSLADNNIIAKISSECCKDSCCQHIKRTYFGPVNLTKLEIKMMDEYGRILDMNNMDYSLSFELEILYDL